VRLDLLAPALGLVYEALHDFGVLAGVDGEHAAVQEGTALLSDRLVLVLRVDVLENLFGGEGLAVVVVALDPQPRGEVVFVVGYIDVILAELLLDLLGILIPRDLNKAPLVLDLALHDLLLGQLLDALHRSGCAVQVLLVRVGKQFARLYGLLPLPPEVRQLVSRYYELLRRQHSSRLEVLIRWRKL